MGIFRRVKNVPSKSVAVHQHTEPNRYSTV
jgi:hypothetical protein